MINKDDIDIDGERGTIIKKNTLNECFVTETDLKDR